MTIDNWINIIASISTLIISSLAVYISYKSINLTQKSIIDANKPYVVVYIETIDGIFFQKFITIKNLGKTPAKIVDLKFHTKLDEINKNFKLSSLIGATIAPNQKFQSQLMSDFKNDIILTLKYIDNYNNLESLDITLKTDFTSQLFWGTEKSSSDTKEITAAKVCTQAIIKHLKN